MAHFDDEEAYKELEPVVRDLLNRVTAARFSTKSFIEAVLATPEGAAAYERAITVLTDDGANDQMAKMVVHGQVFPALLRQSALVRFAGFIHGNPDHDDGYAVPSWWTRV